MAIRFKRKRKGFRKKYKYKSRAKRRFIKRRRFRRIRRGRNRRRIRRTKRGIRKYKRGSKTYTFKIVDNFSIASGDNAGVYSNKYYPNGLGMYAITQPLGDLNTIATVYEDAVANLFHQPGNLIPGINNYGFYNAGPAQTYPRQGCFDPNQFWVRIKKWKTKYTVVNTTNIPCHVRITKALSRRRRAKAEGFPSGQYNHGLTSTPFTGAPTSVEGGDVTDYHAPTIPTLIKYGQPIGIVGALPQMNKYAFGTWFDETAGNATLNNVWLATAYTQNASAAVAPVKNPNYYGSVLNVVGNATQSSTTKLGPLLNSWNADQTEYWKDAHLSPETNLFQNPLFTRHFKIQKMKTVDLPVNSQFTFYCKLRKPFQFNPVYHRIDDTNVQACTALGDAVARMDNEWGRGDPCTTQLCQFFVYGRLGTCGGIDSYSTDEFSGENSDAYFANHKKMIYMPAGISIREETYITYTYYHKKQKKRTMNIQQLGGSASMNAIWANAVGGSTFGSALCGVWNAVQPSESQGAQVI